MSHSATSTGRATGALLLILCVAALCALPWLLPAGQLVAAVQMLIAALFACAFNLLAGQGGMLSFGHAAYFGVGTFATIHAMNALGGAGLLPTPLMPLIGGVAGLLFGVVAGWFATMRSGVYFSMITLALAELLHALAPHLKGVFGGEAGVSAMRMPAWGFTFGSDIEVYYLVLAWVVVSLAALYGLTRTPLGRLTLGLRENANRLRYLGYRPHALKTMVFALSAMFAGIAGGLQALNIEAGNYVLFEVKLSTDAVLFAYIGGVNAFLGPVLGASILTFLSQTLADITRSWLLYQGILFVLVMLFVPDGLVGLVLRAAKSLRERGLANWLPRAAVSVAGGLLLTGATVFTVELLQRMFARDYRALLAMNPEAGWPAIPLFGQEWAPLAVSTWLVPVALFAVGLAACRWALTLWRDAGEAAPLLEPAK
ncbi:branched-chain amino acid ABC transporter permease [Achromobacter insolitus]|uniref:branched-chain amino acid ABC transporter permease n=1 Tax=Achromobacter insolitus TaxID=217204 RepID=UPI00174CB8F7|nr:branched-chain amino acid ABC transporter permease [Achromobacter insolitus]